jgi:hypothetical protein
MSRIFFLVICCVASFLTHAQFSGTSFADAQKSKKAALVCLYSLTPGYIERGNDGVAKGLLPEIMKAFASYEKKKNSIEISYQYEPVKNNTPMNEIFKAVHTSDDGVIGLIFVFITEDRKKNYNFSSTIFESPSFLITPSNVADITSEEDARTKLKGFTAYVNKGNFYEDRFKDLKSKYVPDLKIEYLKTYSATNSVDVLGKEKSAQYVDISGLLYLLDNKIAMKNQKALQFSIPMGITFSAKSSWITEFNTFLADGFLKGSDFKKIVADNLGVATMRMLKL